MTCSFCTAEGVTNIDSAGDCAVCNRSACTHPSGRYDRRFHGYVCECRCGQFVCRRHFASHARSHPGGAPQVCFPTPTTLSSGAALAVIEHGLGVSFDAVLPMLEIEAIGDFIVHFAVGAENARAVLAAEQQTPVELIAEDEVSPAIGRMFSDPLRTLVVAPTAVHYLRHALHRVRDRSALPPFYAELYGPLVAMSRIQSDHNIWSEPFTPRSISAFALVSPRIAAAMALLQGRVPQTMQSPFELLPFFDGPYASTLLNDDEALARVAQTPPTLSALLPVQMQAAAG